MLILSRRKDESVVIDGRIEVSIVDIKGDQVKLGIKAPRDVKVFRHEVYQAIQDQNRAALESPVELPSLDLSLFQTEPNDLS
ncbi:MAG: carbon storage regulator CsrA [Spirochaetales bacterium]|nr:carbon storage regulator CsrA [Spirochaetales bacterium]